MKVLNFFILFLFSILIFGCSEKSDNGASPVTPPPLNKMSSTNSKNSISEFSHINGKGYFDLFKTYDAETDAELEALYKTKGIVKDIKDPLPDYKFLSKDELPAGIHIPTWEEMKEKGTNNGTFFLGTTNISDNRTLHKILGPGISFWRSSWAYPVNDSIIYVGSRSQTSEEVYWLQVLSIVQVNGTTKWYAESGIVNDNLIQVSDTLNTKRYQPEVGVYGYHNLMVEEGSQMGADLHTYARAKMNEWDY
jgi:hypothetical protein